MIHETLSNGLEVVLKPNHFTHTVALQLWIKVGSLQESENNRGAAHFLEHMAFKGTERRGVGEIASLVEECGGEINAYTSFDQTVIHLTMSASEVDTGVDLLADVFGHSRLANEEFEREREVILEEIRRSLDSPGSMVGRKVFELAFSGTEAARPIFGSLQSVKDLTVEDLRCFYREWYVPNNAVLVCVGAFDEERLLETIKQTFGVLKAGPNPRRSSLDLSSQNLFGRKQSSLSVIKGDFQLARIELVFPAPAMGHLDSVALDLAAFALGAGEVSRLNRRIRDDQAVVQSIGASVYSASFGGVFEISAFVKEDKMDEAIKAILRELILMRELEPITDEELERARANLRSDRVLRDETVDGQAQSLGAGMLTSHKFLYEEVYSTLVESMPIVAVTGALRRWILPEFASVVALVNEQSLLTEEELKSSIDEALKSPLIAPKRAAKSYQSRDRKSEQPQTQVFNMAPGLKFIYKHYPEGKVFSLTAATEGGLRHETNQNQGIQHAIAGLLATATKKQSYESYVNDIESIGASLEGFSGKDSLGFHLQCLPTYLPKMLPTFRDSILTPEFPGEQWATLVREIHQSIESQEDSPAGTSLRKLQEAIYQEHPYRHQMVGTKQSVAEFNPSQLKADYVKFRDQGPWVIAAVGPVEPAKMVQDLGELLGDWKLSPNSRQFTSDQLLPRLEGGRKQRIRLPKEREQTHIAYGFPGLSWGDQDRFALDVLTNILGGHGGRLFQSLREKESLAYTVTPILSYGKVMGLVASYIATSPDKVTKALAALKREMYGLVEAKPGEDELSRAKKYIIGSHEMSLQRGDAHSTSMALMEAYGFGYRDYMDYPDKIREITADDVLRVATRLFKEEESVEVIIGKNEP